MPPAAGARKIAAGDRLIVKGAQGMSTVAAPAIGANSEVGVLRTALVHRPDLAHERLSPTNRREIHSSTPVLQFTTWISLQLALR